MENSAASEQDASTERSRRLLLIVALEAVERSVSHLACRHGDAVADEVGSRLLRRLETGTAFADSEGWVDATGAPRRGAVHLWMRRAAEGELCSVLGRRDQHAVDPDALIGAMPAGPDRVDHASISQPDLETSERLVMLAAVRRASRGSRAHPATRAKALAVIDARLRGRTYAAVAAELGMPTNTAIQYARRLLASCPPPLQRRVARASRSAARAQRRR